MTIVVTIVPAASGAPTASPASSATITVDTAVSTVPTPATVAQPSVSAAVAAAPLPDPGPSVVTQQPASLPTVSIPAPAVAALPPTIHFGVPVRDFDGAPTRQTAWLNDWVRGNAETPAERKLNNWKINLSSGKTGART